MDERVKRLIAENAESIKLRLVLGLLANDDGIVPYEKSELANLFGVSEATIRRRLKQAGVREDSVGRILSPKLSDSLLQNCARILYNAQDVYNDINNIADQNDTPDWKDVVEQYKRLCEEKYGVKPRIDYRKAKNTVNAFLRRHGRNVYAILDAIFTNYDTVWKTKEYTIPPFGAVFGWMGDQAVRYVERRIETKTNESRYDDITSWL